jgi:hypothetical protein
MLGTDGSIGTGGTAFFVAVDDPLDEGSHVQYLVTDRHSIDGIKRDSKDGLVRVRYNKLDGTASTISIAAKNWVAHPDQTVDLAIVEIDPILDGSYAAWRVGNAISILTPERAAEEAVGIGDEVVITGLFKRHKGVRRNVAPLRTGAIAAMPDDDEPLESGIGPTVAYLVEVRSLGGLSGAPVFIVFDPNRWAPNPSTLKRRQDEGYYILILGVIQGHWDEKVESSTSPDANEEKINQGMAIVTPAWHILTLLEDAGLKAPRDKTFASRREAKKAGQAP